MATVGNHGQSMLFEFYFSKTPLLSYQWPQKYQEKTAATLIPKNTYYNNKNRLHKKYKHFKFLNMAYISKKKKPPEAIYCHSPFSQKAGPSSGDHQAHKTLALHPTPQSISNSSRLSRWKVPSILSIVIIIIIIPRNYVEEERIRHFGQYRGWWKPIGRYIKVVFPTLQTTWVHV